MRSPASGGRRWAWAFPRRRWLVRPHRVSREPGQAPALILDALGKKCPIPIIMLADRIREVPVGQTIAVLADDPAAKTDLPAWCALKSQEFVRADALTGGLVLPGSPQLLSAVPLARGCCGHGSGGRGCPGGLVGVVQRPEAVGEPAVGLPPWPLRRRRPIAGHRLPGWPVRRWQVRR